MLKTCEGSRRSASSSSDHGSADDRRPTPSATTSRRSSRGRPRSSGRAIAQSAAEPNRSRRKTTPGGPNDGKSDFATAAPPCTEQAAASTSPTADAGLFLERKRRTDGEQ